MFLACFSASDAAESGEIIPIPISRIVYVLTPGKRTGKEFYFEKTLCKEIRFDPELPYVKPMETITQRFSLRGGYRPQDVFGHSEFTLNASKDVATGWLPISSGHFLIFPDKSKEHLPRFVPERTKLVRVPLIRKYADKEVNAYDLALALDRVNKGEAESIPLRIIPSTADKDAVYLIPNQPLPMGVYYACSTTDDVEKSAGVVHGFLFAVGVPASGESTATTSGVMPDFTSRPYRQDNPLWIAGYAPKSTEPNNPQLGNALGNCTWYANGRLRELGYSKDDLDKLIHDASKWDDIAQDNGIPISKTPSVGSIAQTDSGANGMGHVAVVESKNADDTITVSESSYAGNNPSSESKWNFLYRTRTVAPSWFQNFIRVRKKDGVPLTETKPTSSQSPDGGAKSGIIVDAALAREVIDYARLCEAIYNVGTAKYVPVPNWEVINPVACSLTEKQTVFSDPVNGFKAQVYVNGKKLAVVFEGTTELIDWSTDITAWLGVSAGQYQDALNFVGTIINATTANYDIIFTGHSLGGGLAAYAALYYRKKAVVFNAAGLGGGLQANLPKENLSKQNEYIRCIDLVGDPVSAFGKQVGTIYTLEVPASMIGKSGFFDARILATGVRAALDPDSVGSAKAVSIDPLVLHSINTVVTVLRTLAK